MTWRNSQNKPLLRESSDRYFSVVSEDEFSEYSKFSETHAFLATPLQKQSFSIKQSHLFVTNEKLNLCSVCMHGTKFYMLNDSEMLRLADWIEEQLGEKAESLI